MDGQEMHWEDYGDDAMMQDYLPALEDLEAMGIDLEELQNLPEEELFQLLQQYMMMMMGGGGGPLGEHMMGDEMMYDDYSDFGPGGMPGMGFDDYSSAGQDFSYAKHMNDCAMPVLKQGLQLMVPLFLLCWSLRMSSVMGIPANVLHMICAFSGIFLLWQMFGFQAAYIVGLSGLAYLLLYGLGLWGSKKRGPICGLACVCSLVTWELFLAEPVDWHKIRGAQMILVMKVVSLGFNLDQGSVASLPGLHQYLGYTLCVGTCVFGPWVSFGSYKAMLQPKPMSLGWIWHVLSSSVLSLFCLLVSVCITPIIFMGYKDKWLHAYKDAASFRYSHYFVSYLSSASSVLAGYGAVTDESGATKWEFSVVKPLHIELPRSLVEVVTNWNLPMHNWLKNYVFKMTRRYGNFTAVLMTYVASSVLHGLNFQLAAVLLSLGVYSYVEYVFRQKLSEIFNACIKARRCKDGCDHHYQARNPLVIIINLLFGCLSIFHLAYLGVMFNSNSEIQEEGYAMSHTLDIWAKLDFASHYVILATAVFYWLIK